MASSSVAGLRPILILLCCVGLCEAFQPSALSQAAHTITSGRSCSTYNAITTQRIKCTTTQRQYTELLSNLLSDGITDTRTDRTFKERTDMRTDIDPLPAPLFERVQRGLARIIEIVPKPILVAVVAVVSGFLFFELSKTLLLLSLPVVVVLGKSYYSIGQH